ADVRPLRRNLVRGRGREAGDRCARRIGRWLLGSRDCDAANLIEFVTLTSDSPELEPGYEEECRQLPDPRGYPSRASAWAGIVGTGESGSIGRVLTEQSANWTEGSLS